MRRWVLWLFAFILVLPLCSPRHAVADIPILKFGPTTFTGSGNMPVITLSGQSTCSMTLSGGGSATITPKGSSDKGNTYATVSAIGAQTADNTYGAQIAPYLTNYYVAVTGVTGSVSVSEACSATVTNLIDSVVTPPPSAGPTATPNGFVIAWGNMQGLPPAQQNANINIDGSFVCCTAGNGLSSLGAFPLPSESPGAGISETSAGLLSLTNLFDPGTTAGTQLFQVRRNTQGAAFGNLFSVNNSNVILTTGGAYTQAVVGVPAAPTPTCSPGGANGSTAYSTKINLVNNNGKGVASSSGTVTCAANTLLVVNRPSTGLSGALFWTVSACTGSCSGSENEQTQGTSPSSGTNIPLSTSQWISTATLAGATPANTTDGSTGENIFYKVELAKNPSATPAPLCGGNTVATFITQCNSNGNGPVPFAVATTTPASCTALVECLTVTANFSTNFTAAPKCTATVQDTTTATNLWMASINSVSVSSVVFNVAPLVATVSAAKGITVFGICQLF